MGRNAKSAVDAGVVDFVLLPAHMPAKLMEIHAAYASQETEGKVQERPVDGEILKNIFSFVRQNSGADFNYYKKPTIIRRIDRRMAINQIGSLQDYLSFLRENKSEQELLFHDLLIKVTSFFRDP